DNGTTNVGKHLEAAADSDVIAVAADPVGNYSLPGSAFGKGINPDFALDLPVRQYTHSASPVRGRDFLPLFSHFSQCMSRPSANCRCRFYRVRALRQRAIRDS